MKMSTVTFAMQDVNLSCDMLSTFVANVSPLCLSSPIGTFQKHYRDTLLGLALTRMGNMQTSFLLQPDVKMYLIRCPTHQNQVIGPLLCVLPFLFRFAFSYCEACLCDHTV